MRPKTRLPFLAAGLAAFAAGGALADIAELDLEKMIHEHADVAVVGEIVEVTNSEFPLDDGSPAAYTNLRVRGKNLYTGEAQEVVASFVGGFIDGQRITTAEEPPANEIQRGRRVVVFTAPWPSNGNAPERSLVAQHGGIFVVEKGPKGDIVIGKGKGYAVEKNVLLSDLQAQAADLWKSRPKPPKSTERPG